MAANGIIYGLFGPEKLNPNLVIVSLTIIAVTLILLYSGRHTRITLPNGISFETNIPDAPDNSNAN